MQQPGRRLLGRGRPRRPGTSRRLAGRGHPWSPSTRSPTTPTPSVAAGRSRSPSPSIPRGRRASTRSRSRPTGRPASAPTRRRSSSSDPSRPRRRPPSSCSPPTPTTPTTSGAAAACTAARRRSRSTARWSGATCAGRRRRSRPTTTAASPASSRRSPTRSTCAPALPRRLRLPAVVRLVGLAQLGAAVRAVGRGTRASTLDFAVNSDLEFHPEVLDGHRLMLSVGHDEYWSWGMRDRADAFVEAGGSWAIFSGNTCFWQVRYEDDGRTMVCYKGQYDARIRSLGTDDAPLPVDHVVAALDRPAGGADDRAQLHPRRLRPGRPGHAPGIGRLHHAPARAPGVRGDRPALRRRARRAAT